MGAGFQAPGDRRRIIGSAWKGGSQMRKAHAALLLWLLFAASDAVLAQRAVLVVRHAEKISDTDERLSDDGLSRAARLAALLKDADVSAIYSTDTPRTRGTAQPLADARSCRFRSTTSSGRGRGAQSPSSRACASGTPTASSWSSATATPCPRSAPGPRLRRRRSRSQPTSTTTSSSSCRRGRRRDAACGCGTSRRARAALYQPTGLPLFCSSSHFCERREVVEDRGRVHLRAGRSDASSASGHGLRLRPSRASSSSCLPASLLP